MKTKKNKISPLNIVLLIFQFFNFSIFQFSLFSQNSLDQLQYNYYSNTNRLEYLIDAVGSATSTVDIDNQSSANYAYDAVGQLTKDVSEGILDIDWTVSGKVKKVSIDDDGNSIADRTLEFKYDALGNRVKKIETTISTSAIQTTIYIRNITGDLISIYESDGTITERIEVNISGVGTDKADEVSASSEIKTRSLGNKNYELKDHLGNMRVIVNDAKEPVDPTNPSIFQSSISNSTDYYSYGMQMPDRDYSSSNYRYGFNGKEKDDELKGNGNSYDFGARLYDSRLGRWLSPDRLESQFPSVATYISMGNDPVNRIDMDGNADKAVCYNEVPVDQRPFYESMDRDSWEKMMQFYKANAALSYMDEEKQNCVTSFNSGVDKLFEEAMGLQIYDSRVNRSAEMLKVRGLASDPVIIKYVDKKGRVAPGSYANPEKMQNSLAREALEMTGCVPGYHVFALSMMDGYHTLTLSVVIAKNGEVGYVLSDHIKMENGGTDGMLVFEHAEELDQWITDYTVGHSSYTGKIHTTIWKLYNPEAGLFSSDSEPQECEDTAWDDDEYQQSDVDENGE